MRGLEYCSLHNPSAKDKARETQIKGARSPKTREVVQLSLKDVRMAFTLVGMVLPALQRVSEKLGRQLGIKGQRGLSEVNLRVLGAVVEIVRLARLISRKPVIQSATKDGTNELDAGIVQET